MSGNVKPLGNTLYMHLKLQAVDEDEAEATSSNNVDAPTRIARGSTLAVDSVGTSAPSPATRQDTLQSTGSTPMEKNGLNGVGMLPSYSRMSYASVKGG